MNRFQNTNAPGYGEFDLQRASDFQAVLLGMAGHDLRQPLQVIQNAYEWLGSRVSRASEKLRLERGERALARLTEQLDRLLGALRLYEHTKGLQLVKVPLAPLLSRIAQECEDAAHAKGIRLVTVDTTAVVLSNPVLLDGVVSNLVRNAVKYTEPGGQILIGCRNRGAEIRIDIYDTGIGIAPEHLPRIFEAFQRLDTARPDGLGIGLFVVRRAVELLGHRVEVISEITRGSRFSILAKAAQFAPTVHAS